MYQGEGCGRLGHGTITYTGLHVHIFSNAWLPNSKNFLKLIIFCFYFFAQKIYWPTFLFWHHSLNKQRPPPHGVFDQLVVGHSIWEQPKCQNFKHIFLHTHMHIWKDDTPKWSGNNLPKVCFVVNSNERPLIFHQWEACLCSNQAVILQIYYTRAP